jgi:hypothetical protein
LIKNAVLFYVLGFLEVCSMESTEIFLNDALKIMQLKDKEGKPFPFDLTYRTFNSQSKQGGKLKIYTAVKHLPDANPNALPSKSIEAIFAEVKSEKKPEHFDNRTRNIELQNGDIKKIRIDFIISINNRKVIY